MIARIFAGSLMLTIWVVVIFPIWFAILLRTISSFSIATVTAFFTGATPPETFRLDTVAELWVNGFIRIVRHMLQQPHPGPYVPINTTQAVVDVLLAIVLYTGVFSTIWTLSHLRETITSASALFYNSSSYTPAHRVSSAPPPAPSPNAQHSFDEIFGTGSYNKNFGGRKN